MVVCFNLININFQFSREKRKSLTHTKPCISFRLATSRLVAERQGPATQVLIWGKDGKCASGQEKYKKEEHKEAEGKIYPSQMATKKVEDFLSIYAYIYDYI